MSNEQTILILTPRDLRSDFDSIKTKNDVLNVLRLTRRDVELSDRVYYVGNDGETIAIKEKGHLGFSFDPDSLLTTHFVNVLTPRFLMRPHSFRYFNIELPPYTDH